MRRNLFGPLHIVPKECSCCSPAEYYTSGEAWTDDYTLADCRLIRPYGIPLDCRADYTKSDWQIWIATLSKDKAVFEKIIAPMWAAYHFSPSRVPMMDWYSTVTSFQSGCGFRHRTVQGGLFMKLLDEFGILKAGKTRC